jgi:hypothetical protein
MQKIILAIVLAAISNSAIAEWTKIGHTANFKQYSYDSGLRKNGSIVKMWSMADYNATQQISSKKYLSTMSQDEYDCKEERTRSLILTWYSDNMGKGDQVYSIHDPQQWEPNPPGSLIEDLWKVACGKLKK